MSNRSGRPLRPETDLQAAIRAGFPQKVVDGVIRSAGITLGELATTLDLSGRSLQRRRGEGRLARIESDRLYRLARIVALAKHYLGNRHRARGRGKHLGPDRVRRSELTRVYRILRKPYATKPFDGEGPYRFGARWSSPGTRVAYVAGHLSLAMLEYYVHLDPEHPPANPVVVEADIPDNVSRISISPKQLPANWRHSPAPAALAGIGDEFVLRERAAALTVPSALAPAESNWLINPRHSAFARIRVYPAQTFRYDSLLPLADYCFRPATPMARKEFRGLISESVAIVVDLHVNARGGADLLFHKLGGPNTNNVKWALRTMYCDNST